MHDDLTHALAALGSPGQRAALAVLAAHMLSPPVLAAHRRKWRDAELVEEGTARALELLCQRQRPYLVRRSATRALDAMTRHCIEAALKERQRAQGVDLHAVQPQEHAGPALDTLRDCPTLAPLLGERDLDARLLELLIERVLPASRAHERDAQALRHRLSVVSGTATMASWEASQPGPAQATARDRVHKRVSRARRRLLDALQSADPAASGLSQTELALLRRWARQLL